MLLFMRKHTPVNSALIFFPLAEQNETLCFPKVNQSGVLALRTLVCPSGCGQCNSRTREELGLPLGVDPVGRMVGADRRRIPKVGRVRAQMTEGNVGFRGAE